MTDHSKLKYWIGFIFSLSVLVYSLIIEKRSLDAPGSSCFFYSFFGFPCAACGGSHALQSLLRLEWLQALRYNILISVLWLVCCLIMTFIGIDVLTRNRFYLKFLSWLNHFSIQYRYPLIIVLIACWIIQAVKIYSF